MRNECTVQTSSSSSMALDMPSAAIPIRRRHQDVGPLEPGWQSLDGPNADHRDQTTTARGANDRAGRLPAIKEYHNA